MFSSRDLCGGGGGGGGAGEDLLCLVNIGHSHGRGPTTVLTPGAGIPLPREENNK